MKKLVALCLLLAIPSVTHAQKTARTYTAGHFFLELNGQTNPLRSMEGGEISAVVSQNGAKKQIGPPVYGDLEVQVGLGIDKALQDWIKAAAQGKQSKTTCTVITADQSYQATSKSEFVDAIISELTIPTLDASSKDQAYLTVKFAPQAIKPGKPSSEKVSTAGVKQKSAAVSNFKLTIDGLDCSKVAKVDAITLKQSKSDKSSGKGSNPTEFSNLKVTFSAASIQTWADWHKSFVIEGKNGDKEERSGTLEFLDPSLKSPLLTIKFQNVGICSLSDEAGEANSEQIRRSVAELYFEGMTIEFPK